MFLAIKDELTIKEIWKARFFFQGHRDNMKSSPVHETFVSKQYSIKIIEGIPAIFRFQLFSSNVTKACIQSTETLTRDVFIEPPKELNLKTDGLIKLLNPLYSLTDNGDYWGKKFRNNL